MAKRLQLRRDTAANWTSANPTLAQGEIGMETDTRYMKLGDGLTPWTTLAYWPVSGDVTDVLAGNGITVTNSSGPQPSVAINTAVTADLTTAQTLAKKALKSPREITTVSATAATGTINYDALTQGVLYYTTNASANFTLNFRGDGSNTLSSILSVGDAITLVFLNTNGATAYYPTTFQIDTSAVTPKWQGGSAPTAGNASSVDAYTFTIVKTAATPTYVVLGSQTKFA